MHCPLNVYSTINKALLVIHSLLFEKLSVLERKLQYEVEYCCNIWWLLVRKGDF